MKVPKPGAMLIPARREAVDAKGARFIVNSSGGLPTLFLRIYESWGTSGQNMGTRKYAGAHPLELSPVTTLRFHADRVEFFLPAAYRRGRIAGYLVCLLIALSFLGSDQRWLCPGFALTALLATLIEWIWSRVRPPQPFLTVFDPTIVEEQLVSGGTTLSASEIESLTVGPAAEERPDEYCEVWLKRKDHAAPILLYRVYWYSRRRALEFADRLSERWIVPAIRRELPAREAHGPPSGALSP